MDKTYEARMEVVRRAMAYMCAVLHSDAHPEDPHASSQIEMEEEYLDRAISDFCKGRV